MRPLAIVFSLLVAQGLCGQGNWIKEAGSYGPDHIADVAVDSAGNSYVVGDFNFSITIDLVTVNGNGARDVVVAKFDPLGNLLWMRSAGGASVDLGLKLALGGNGALAVVGAFTGTVDLFGTTITGNGGMDAFLAVLNASDGTTQWVRTGGSSAYADTPGAVTIAPNGNVVMAGKFKSTATFDGGVLTSAIDPWTQNYGFDVFIQAYSATGASLWLQQGSGSHDEEAVELIHDAQSNLYVTGQYSDTLTFDLPHPNIALNSIYVVRFDAAGQEQWFRKCGGTIFNHVTDMRLGSDGNLLLCGNVQGSMQWVDVVPVVIPSAYDHAYFILRVSASGTLLGSAIMGSDNEVRSSSIAEQADSLVVFGDFQCDFTGLQDAYQANGIFMAIGTHDFFISKHAKSSLAFIKAQQFGAGSDVRAGQVETTPNDGLTFCGSQDNYVLFPAMDGSWGESIFWGCGLFSPNNGLTYCSDPQYGTFAHVRTAGLMDGFVGSCLDEARAPYDYWRRYGQPPCTRVNLLDSVCIGAQGYTGCQDTVEACGSIGLLAFVPFAVPDFQCIGEPTVAPPMNIGFWENWGGGFSNPLQMTATSTGWYHFQASTYNGCWSVLDSIYVVIHPLPNARFTASDSSHVNQPPINPCTNVETCDSLWLYASSMQPGEVAQWQIPGGTIIPNDSAFTLNDGTYILTITAANGCTRQNKVCVEIIDPYQPPNVTGIDFTYMQNGDTITAQDTLYTCTGCVTGAVLFTWYIDSLPAPPPPGMPVTYINFGGCISNQQTYASGQWAWGAQVPISGWYDLGTLIHFDNLPCDSDDFEFQGGDSVYVVRMAAPQLLMPQAVPACPGDTVTLVVQCPACDSLAWNFNSGIIYTSAGHDTIVVNAFGTYGVQGFVIGPGIMCTSYASVSVYTAPLPNIYINPADGVICPNDSAIVFTYGWATGTGYEWQGPGGIITANNDSIYVSEPGDYYLTVTTVSGCPVSNGPVTLVEFSSPFIQALPSNILCSGGSVLLEVVSGPGATLQWQAPLFGSSPTQTVYQPGIYICNVMSCGVLWVLDIEVFASGISATVDAGSGFLCSADPLLLVGPDSAAQYLWLPDSLSAQSILVDAPGLFQLIVFDGNGCSDTSAVITVDTMSFSDPLSAMGDTVCAGEVALLMASGSDSLTWYSDAFGSTVLAVGDSLAIGPLGIADTVFVAQTENGCTGDAQAVIAMVIPLAPVPVVEGDTALCEGDALTLYVQAQPGVDHTWNTPFGAVNGDTVHVAVVGSPHAGIYSVVASGAGLCNSTTSLAVSVTPLPGLALVTGDTVLCTGDALVLNAAAPPGTSVQWNGPQGNWTSSTLTIASVGFGDAGTYACYLLNGDCPGEPVFVEVVVVGPDKPPVLSGAANICEGDPFVLTVNGVNANAALWTLPDGTTITTNPLVIDPASIGNSGAYQCIVPSEPCPDFQLSIEVLVEDCDVIVPNVFSPNGDGTNDVLVVHAPLGLELTMRLYNRWGQHVAQLSGAPIRWDGRNTFNNDLLSDGVYFYVLPLPERIGGGELTGYVHLLSRR